MAAAARTRRAHWRTRTPNPNPNPNRNRNRNPNPNPNQASALEDPLDVLKRGYAVALSLSTLGVIIASYCFLYTDTHPG